MLQLVGAIIVLLAAKLMYDIIREQIRVSKEKKPKGGEVIDLSQNWIDINNLPYRKRDQLLNAREMMVYHAVQEMIGNSPYVVLPKVRLADIIQLSADAANRQEHAQRVKERSVDLLVCQYPDLTPVLALQVEPPSADGKRKSRGDRFVRQSLQAAGIPAVMINPNQLPDSEEILRLLSGETAEA
ncbi:MAG TPA: DUF2726 domain-containing protein [Syntrophomonadaceae bacterium]|nr:DUF2726 domain-containing protein [Syntrophomonadaceae bacterium]HOQ10616.1 DUF2726 domain-containing protein [Syntrophomonadaceae bacterium]HPU49361.1 DUF2726 domain-containing protein [Syntrophomonadaceae bacterium]